MRIGPRRRQTRRLARIPFANWKPFIVSSVSSADGPANFKSGWCASHSENSADSDGFLDRAACKRDRLAPRIPQPRSVTGNNSAAFPLTKLWWHRHCYSGQHGKDTGLLGKGTRIPLRFRPHGEGAKTYRSSAGMRQAASLTFFSTGFGSLAVGESRPPVPFQLVNVPGGTPARSSAAR